MSNIKWIDEVDIQNKRVLLLVDYNVKLSPDFKIDSNERILRPLPTIKYLLKKRNKLILISHLGQPKEKEEKYSLKHILPVLRPQLPSQEITFIDDFLSAAGQEEISAQKENEILLLENMRFYSGEKNGNPEFIKQLASLGEIYVNDAFSVSHRNDASVIGPPKLLPSYGGLLLKKEVKTISQYINQPKKPYVVIIGGTKISTKINLLGNFFGHADTLIVGGGVANTILKQQGYTIGKSIEEPKEYERIKILFKLAKEKNTEMLLPADVLIGKNKEDPSSLVKKVNELAADDMILDIGPETSALYAKKISQAETIVWNGPMGYFENPVFANGTNHIYNAIVQNNEAVSIVGGGQTLAAISKKEQTEKITHISTGGGAMLEFIEKGTLPGLQALSTE
ncbi:phosphoglycerate kinase [Candidatus Roizmanbacteria bacterium RIFCSPLOWO2_12_FULL_40_12]|uniref:Phosphoglycerate kinase n=1 Tax=Candidatus Roizmanbacteria bacterium RIFCSPLOWO2_01_FULL_40_42 TaxID=1802066 RepID=A0A1F7J635_9BACT|nr:MAG: phosphoglycerate kinase [Candidatus Roizmanbacteria bacterium RIFCSPHIGHO2_01_FULL_40_98]OGK27875.1 MAG: phosphoglycerate kinase [Candidatus Roizmanbacteria bacterium RIFCSPHIGHO2_02_FULL_40_53]OGK29412.1 MAG: phosphoglycerate kinase [Candidatus Roizmanbacteria bacterium RIFCSPHIGHO2_12_41_18]OGK36615.1 MAG: phosphoglycerate kinase [Candidatus Roizmanbacteria bacterium RIFCSPHIGHO2_12_FULL_40_130]OGK51053.1 MAG: phosphoglycerate kinase [Candidatus Roizmanbacteria bacterium RIFCSPLOWO2_0